MDIDDQDNMDIDNDLQPILESNEELVENPENTTQSSQLTQFNLEMNIHSNRVNIIIPNSLNVEEGGEDEEEDEEESSYNISRELTNLTYNINSYRNRLVRYNTRPDSSYNSNYSNTYTYNYDTSNLNVLNNSTTTAFNRLLNTSFYDKSKYKNILSEKGNNDLKRIVYAISDNLEINTVCPIYQVEFNDGMEIIKLPCNHCFVPEAIQKWLNEENALCPVCRAKLDSIEIEDSEQNTNYTNNSNQNTNLIELLRRTYNYPINNPLWSTNTENTENTENDTITIPETDEQPEITVNPHTIPETDEQPETTVNLHTITNNFITDIMNQMMSEQNEQDEEDLQTAIFNSLNDVGNTPMDD